MTQVQTLLAANLKEARRQLAWSQMQLAERCGITTSFLGEIEVGRKFPSPKTLQALADALGLKPFQLFFDAQEWERLDRLQVVSSLARTIKERVNRAVDDAVSETLRNTDAPPENTR